MKKLLALTLVAVCLTACSDPVSTMMPDEANFELVDTTARVLAADVNAHVYGSFVISFGGAPAALGNGVTANFPGNPKNAGTCGLVGGADDGVWYNSQGRRTSGSAEQPHPHCASGASGSQIQVVLEPISVENGNVGANDEFLRFTARDGQGGGFNYDGIRIQGSGGRNTNAQGTIVAYAIDAATLNSGNPKRVGILTIDLEASYLVDGSNLFQSACVITGVTGTPRCLDRVIGAAYEPHGPDAVGTSITLASGQITGFLYWTPATAPFNY